MTRWLCAVLLLVPVIAFAEGLDLLPKSPLGTHVRAWFEAYEKGDDAAIAAYAQAHVGEAARTRTPLAQRVAGMKSLKADHGALTIVNVPEDNTAEIAVVVRDAHGDYLELGFLGEPSPPNLIAGLRIEPRDGPAGGPSAPAGPPVSEAGLADAVRKLLPPDFRGVIQVGRGDRTLFTEVRGVADRATGAKVTPETAFNIASIGKILTKVALAQLAAAGKIALDDPVTKYLPEYRVANAEKITLAMLVDHKGGVDDVLTYAHEVKDRAKLTKLQGWLDLIEDKPLLFEPGSQQRYSNGGYVLLGAVIARVSGEDYYDYVKRHVLDPAGMTATGWPLAHSASPNRAIGYSKLTPGDHHAAPSAEERPMQFEWPERGSPAGGAFGTAGDLMKFARAMRASQLAPETWTGWTLGGPLPTGGAAALPRQLGFGIAGGAPGTNCVLELAGDYDFVILTNADPPNAEVLDRSLRALLRRVQA